MLIAGDAFVTTKQESFISVLTQRREFHGPPAYYTSDWEAAQLSVGRLADLQPSVVATGHGLPVSGVAAFNGLNSLADDFDFRAAPARGRYVREPAVTDESGIVYLPPATYSVSTNVLLATAVAGAVWFALSRRTSRSD